MRGCDAGSGDGAEKLGCEGGLGEKVVEEKVGVGCCVPRGGCSAASAGSAAGDGEEDKAEERSRVTERRALVRNEI